MENNNDNPNNNNTTQKPEPITYICLGNPDDGSKLELDLVTFREKGQQIKYFSVNFSEPEGKISKISLDENSFNEIKKYFLQLDWNG